MILSWSYSCVIDLHSTFLSNPEGHNSDSTSLLFHQLQCWMAGPWEGWWWWIPFTITTILGLGAPGGYLAVPGRAALLGRPVFFHLFFFLYQYYQNIFLHLSFLLVAFAVDCLLQCRVKFRSGFWQEGLFLYSNILGLHANLHEQLAVAGSDYDVLV